MDGEGVSFRNEKRSGGFWVATGEFIAEKLAESAREGKEKPEFSMRMNSPSGRTP
jgi:hypothetical protein